MGKADKKKPKEDIEEEVVLSKREAAKAKYPQVTGKSRDFIVKILNRVEKAPRVKANFEKIISSVEAKRDEEGSDDPQLDMLVDQLNGFVGVSSGKVSSGFVTNPTDFNDCTHKFEFNPM